MTLEQLLTYFTWGLFVTIFMVAVLRAIRQPLAANVHVALLFAAPNITFVLAFLAGFGVISPGPIPNAINTSVLIVLAYLMLQLVDDFTNVPRLLNQAATLGGVILVVGAFAFAPPRPSWHVIFQVIYVVGLQFYAAAAFIQKSRQSRGVTKRRLRAVAYGSVLLGTTVLVSMLRGLVFTPETGQALVVILALSTALAYFLGFTPPSALRRAWQEPELRAFFRQTAALPRITSIPTILQDLEERAADSLGAPSSKIGLWNRETETLQFLTMEPPVNLSPHTDMPASLAFRTQQPIFTPDVQRDHPDRAHISQKLGARAVLAAPITINAKQLGVLTVYAPKASIFADSDQELVQLLADHAAVILESRTLISEATRVQAQEEASRMKDDFLSSAAHDLKTPLTTLVAQTQLMEQRLMRNPNMPIKLETIQRLAREAERLRDIVIELLDASQIDRGLVVTDYEKVDLASLIKERCERFQSRQHRYTLEIPDTLVGLYDRSRIAQVIDQLMSNAVKYSREGGEILVRAWRDADHAHITFTDHGIGIPSEDLPHIFERFYRGRNIDDRQYAGLGLGLFISRGIVEQHGGRIWVESTAERGSTFHIVLPLLPIKGNVYA